MLPKVLLLNSFARHPQFPRVMSLWLLTNFVTACIKNRHLGPINPYKLSPTAKLFARAAESKNSELKIYRDGVLIDVSAQMKILKEANQTKLTPK